MLTPAAFLTLLVIGHLSVFLCLMIPVLAQFGDMCDRIGIFGALRSVFLAGVLSLVPYMNIKEYAKDEPIEIRFFAREED